MEVLRCGSASFKLNLPWTLHHKKGDHETLMDINKAKPIQYPKPDGIYTFDKLNSISLSNIGHDANQPCHLKLNNQEIPISYNYPRYNSPEQRYCPAGVYEIVKEGDSIKLQINSQNCIHCKTCDIKDPQTKYKLGSTRGWKWSYLFKDVTSNLYPVSFYSNISWLCSSIFIEPKTF